ncbi:MAG: respiratory chain complex I subunit 1 family protein [Candidatus Gastranaerophilaceae bacterium]
MENTIYITIINTIIMLIAPFFVIGLIKKTKAFWGGRKGVSIFQPLYDTVKLFRKGQVISSTTTWIFTITPIVVFITTFFAGLLAPMIAGISIINITGAFIIFSYILGFGKFFALISAMDTGSSFEGMGASREACFTTIVEPAFFMILATVTALSGNFSFNAINNVLQNSGNFGILIIIFAVIALLIMLLTECSRVPVDDPTTHLELTMIHEVMILDNSGIDLALLTWSCGIKMVIIMSLIANFIIPQQIGIYNQIFLFIAVFVLLSLLIGTIEATMARFRMSHVFEFIFIMSSLALVIASLAAVKLYGV